MDPDDKRIQKQLNDLEIHILKQRSNILSDDSNVFQPIWFRRAIQSSNGLDRFLLDYGFNFLPYSGVLFWIIYLFTL